MGSLSSAVLAVWLTSAMLGGCAASRLPPPPPGVSLSTGRYVQEYYVAPSFAPERASYVLGPFTVEQAQGVTAEAFLAVLQAELTRAWEANGLKLADAGPCRLTLAIHQVAVSHGRLRVLLGRLSARTTVSGHLSQNGHILFAFRDRLSLDSPVSPGPPAPQETGLLLQRLSRELAHRLLNELLLHGLAADASESSANTRTSSRGRL